jgi:general bacterial porin, GBP family
MKKTLIAMAVLAASGASFAQVTLYGVVGGQFQSQETKTVNSSGGITEAATDGFGNVSAIGSSRFGMRGTEDLGGGLSANFNLEATANVADGTTTSTNSQLFNRQSWAGLSGGFGAVRLGRSTTPYYETIGLSDPFATTGLSTIGVDNQTPSGRVSNGLFYTSPKILGGFTVNALYGAWDTTGAATGAGDTKNIGLSVGYSAGPLAFSLGFGDAEVLGTVGAVGTGDTDGQTLSATYDFGAAKLFAGYAKTQANGYATTANTYTEVENSEINVGVTVPMGAVTLLAGIGRNSRTTVAANGAETANATGDGNDWVLGAYYNLSKRTVAYVKAGVIGEFDFGAETTGSAIGIRHAF